MKIFKAVLLTVFAILVSSIVTMGAEMERLTIQSPPSVGALPLIWMKESGAVSDRVALDIRISSDHQRGIALIAQKDIEMLVTGVNVGAKAYNKGIDLRLLNTNIWGIDYLLTGGFKAESWQELQGRTLSLPLKGGPLDFLARYFLIKNGVDPEKIDYVYMASNNGVRTFQLGRVDAIILPEPLVTLTLNNCEQAILSFDLQEEWAKIHDGEDRIPFVGLFVRGDYAEENPELVAVLNSYYQTGIDWVKTHPDEAASLASDYFGQPAHIIQESFGRINLNTYSDWEARGLIELYFGEIMGLYPEMIGGKLPDEEFYF